MHDTGVQHARKTNVRYPCLLCRYFRHRHGVGERFSYDGVLADRLQRRISVHPQATHAAQIAFYRDREIQLCVLDEIAIRHALTAPGDNTAFHSKLIFRRSEILATETDQRLIALRAPHPKIRLSPLQEIACTAANRSSI